MLSYTCACYYIKYMSMMSSTLSPMKLNNLLHNILTDFPQVLLVVCQFRRRALTRVNFTVLCWGIKAADKVPCKHKVWFRKTKHHPGSHLYSYAALPSVSMRYFWPTSFIYSSMALVARVFSLKISASFSPRRSTSALPKSVRNSWNTVSDTLFHCLIF